jgi:hypothetical protein
MKDLGETTVGKVAPKGNAKTLRQKGPGLDDTLESDSAPKKQFSVSLF